MVSGKPSVLPRAAAAAVRATRAGTKCKGQHFKQANRGVHFAPASQASGLLTWVAHLPFRSASYETAAGRQSSSFASPGPVQLPLEAAARAAALQSLARRGWARAVRVDGSLQPMAVRQAHPAAPGRPVSPVSVGGTLSPARVGRITRPRGGTARRRAARLAAVVLPMAVTMTTAPQAWASSHSNGSPLTGGSTAAGETSGAHSASQAAQAETASGAVRSPWLRSAPQHAGPLWSSSPHTGPHTGSHTGLPWFAEELAGFPMPSANNSLPQPAYIPGSMARSEGATGPRSHAAVEGGDQLTPRAHGARLHHTAMDQSGAIANFGDAPFLGAPTGRDVSGIAIAPSKKGYWVATSAGNVFGYGNVHTYGGPEGRIGGALVTGIASTPDGSGYWVVTSAGSVFTYGDAKFFGSLGTSHLTSPVVGITSAPRGRGYWLVTSQGAVYAFGAARFFGPDKQPDFPSPVIGMAVTANGTGYWLATSAGDVYSFGGARFFGSLGDQKTEVSAIAATPDGRGYYLLTASGHVHAFGAAAALGSPVLASSSTAATSLATTSDGKGYVVATGGGSLVAG
ncbi:MAG TPA: hypothetical protein VFN61_02950, partial [Acidimicrobiales bacterium]|nr:hypothetical protein [Acidimicrobiales bacterium]